MPTITLAIAQANFDQALTAYRAALHPLARWGAGGTHAERYSLRMLREELLYWAGQIDLLGGNSGPLLAEFQAVTAGSR